MIRKPLALLSVGLFIIFLVAAGITAFLVYNQSHDFFVSFDLAQLPGIAIHGTPTPAQVAEGTPIPTPLPTLSAGPPPQPWDGASRVTILILGLDYRDWEAGEGPPRTDTMILMTVDPLTMTAGMLNIPRDLWVNIPGFDYGRINTAYRLGELYQVPGVPSGGPGLAIQTVEALLGIHIDYYAQIDFYAFERFIDELGGVYVDVPAEIRVDPIGEHNTVTLQPGRQLLDGPTALAYARARNTENADFDRADRQQQVILAIRARVFELGPAELAAHSSALYEELAAGIHTNMPLDDAMRLAWLVVDIPLESIRRGSIAPPNAVILAESPDGSQLILIPVPDQIRLIRDYVFASGGWASPVLGSGDALANMQAEAATLMILNGTYFEGLAGRTQEYLVAQGVNVIGTGNADYTVYTRIIDYTGNPYLVSYLVELMNITPYSIILDYNPNSQVDVAVVLGDDWAGNNPMP